MDKPSIQLVPPNGKKKTLPKAILLGLVCFKFNPMENEEFDFPKHFNYFIK